MPDSCYKTAWERATSEIAEIDAQMQKLARRKDLLEKLLEPLEQLISESGSVDIPGEVPDGSNAGVQDQNAAVQGFPAGVIVGVSELEPAPLEAADSMMQPWVDETKIRGSENGQFSHEDVAGLAYNFWHERGQTHGQHEEDWFRAAQQLQDSSH